MQYYSLTIIIQMYVISILPPRIGENVMLWWSGTILFDSDESEEESYPSRCCKFDRLDSDVPELELHAFETALDLELELVSFWLTWESTVEAADSLDTVRDLWLHVDFLESALRVSESVGVRVPAEEESFSDPSLKSTILCYE